MAFKKVIVDTSSFLQVEGGKRFLKQVLRPFARGREAKVVIPGRVRAELTGIAQDEYRLKRNPELSARARDVLSYLVKKRRSWLVVEGDDQLSINGDAQIIAAGLQSVLSGRDTIVVTDDGALAHDLKTRFESLRGAGRLRVYRGRDFEQAANWLCL